MDKKLDVEKVESALKRAARTAVSGDKRARAGRVVYREAATGRFVEKTHREKDSNSPKSK